MFKYIIEDYLGLGYILSKGVLGVKEEGVEYNYKTKEKHQKHDKIVRDILNDKEEVCKIINKYGQIKNKITKEEIEKYETSYITKNFQNKETDIVYKVKGKEVYYLIEHQTKVEKNMAYRMAEYSLEIMRSRIITNNVKVGNYPKVIPIVIYTGKSKWTAEIKLRNIQEKYELEDENNLIQVGYNLIDIRDKKEALEDDLLISKISILEKAESTEEILDIIDKLAKKITNKEKREKLQRIIEYLFEETLLKEEMKEVKEKLKNEEGSDIMHVHEVLRRDRENYAKEARKEGIKTGMVTGIKTRTSKSSKENARRKNGHRLNYKNNRFKERRIYEIKIQKSCI